MVCSTVLPLPPPSVLTLIHSLSCSPYPLTLANAYTYDVYKIIKLFLNALERSQIIACLFTVYYVISSCLIQKMARCLRFCEFVYIFVIPFFFDTRVYKNPVKDFYFANLSNFFFFIRHTRIPRYVVLRWLIFLRIANDFECSLVRSIVCSRV